MQINAPPPLPVSITVLPQDTAKAVQQVLPQVVVTQTQSAVKAPPKSEGGNKARSESERGKPSAKTERGGTVNVKV